MDFTLHVHTTPVFYENSYVLVNPESHEAILVDPGEDSDTLVKTLDQRGWRPVAALITHAHLDHLAGLPRCKDRWPELPIYLHESDLELYRHFPQQPGWLGLAMEAPELPDPDGWVRDGDILELAGLAVRVVETPGHSPGSVCYVVGGALFSGDTLFQGSIGRTDLPGGSYEEIIRSIMTRLLPLGDDTRVYPGHGPDTTLGRERLTNPFLQLPYVPL